VTGQVAIIMGSQSDWDVMQHAEVILKELGVTAEARIVSAHRTPDRMVAFAKGAAAEGFKVIIAGAGGAAHLPGMVASLTALPVLGVPVNATDLDGDGQPVIDRPNAGRDSGGDAGARQGWGEKCGPARRADFGAGGCGAGHTPFGLDGEADRKRGG